jgi:inner membrane protein
VDPIAHTFAGAALAAAGLRRRTPLATAALVLGANAPDIDALSYVVAGSFESLAFRRGWTHGVLALAVLPFLLTGLLLLWDRHVRRRRQPHAAPARAGPLLALAALGVISHPLLDWLNNYGLRWLMPFDGRWFYGDALFIIDPWLWLILGGVLFLMHSRHAASLGAWTVLWSILSLVVFTGAPLVSSFAQALWLGGIGLLLAARALGIAAPRREAAVEHGTRVALGLIAIYATAAVVSDIPARRAVRAELAARGVAPVTGVMVAPVPANPFAGDVVAATPEAYYTGRWRWLPQPRFTLDADPIPRPRDGIYEAAAQTRDAQHFLSWSRFPYVEIETDAAGRHTVQFFDARYRGSGGIGGPTVRLDRNLQSLASD